MSRVFGFIGIIVGTQFIVSLPTVANTTYVSGHITSDMSWTKAGSPYVVEGDVYVDSLVTLTIEPGVEVKLDSMKCIEIYGTLNAIGTENDSIIISALDTTKKWSRLWFKNASAGSISYCRIEYAGESAVYDSVASSLVIEYNIIINDSADYGGGICSYGSPTITGNTISNNSAYEGGSGICSYDGSPIIKYNTIIDPTASAIYIYSDSALIDSNNIYATGYAVHNFGENDIDARYNYWGTVSSDTIALFKIWDFYDDSTRGIVYYEPFLTEPLDFGIEEHKSQVTSHKLQVEIYPNPFIQKTEIRCQIPDVRYQNSDIRQGTSNISLKIYDLSGRLVESFGLDKSSPYKNVIKWEPKNLASGIYFVKLATEDFSEVQKVTIVK